LSARYPCQECEDGQCPCGTGCPACVGTGMCEHCHGTDSQLEVPGGPTRPNRTSTRSPYGARWCATCHRRVLPLARPPRLDEVAHLSARTQQRWIGALRCTGCHRPFPTNEERPNSYRLREAS
jgi:hypothetical protein